MIASVLSAVFLILLALAVGFKYGFKKGRAAHEAEMTEMRACLAQFVQHNENQSSLIHTVRTLSSHGCTIVWHK